MPRFEWTGRRGGQSAAGTVEADSKEQVLAQLRAQGIQVQSISTSAEEGWAEPGNTRSGPSPRTLRWVLVAIFLLAALLIFSVPFLRVIF